MICAGMTHIYSNQYVKVNYNNCLSSPFKLKNGVRQGGILSPLLFNIYINNVIKSVSQSKVGCKLGIFSSNIIAYADDLVVLAPSVSALQNLLNICYNETKNILLNFNTEKSVCVKFKKCNKFTEINSCIELGNVTLKFVEQMSHLNVNPL